MHHTWLTLHLKVTRFLDMYVCYSLVWTKKDTSKPLMDVFSELEYLFKNGPICQFLGLLLGCHAQCHYKSFASFYCILFCHIWLLFLEACSFLMIDKTGVDLEERRSQEKSKGVEGQEIVIRMYFMRIITYF